jgi:hypothetical protein
LDPELDKNTREPAFVGPAKRIGHESSGVASLRQADSVRCEVTAAREEARSFDRPRFGALKLFGIKPIGGNVIEARRDRVTANGAKTIALELQRFRI